MMMMTMTDGLSNPLLWIVIAMILDHALTTKTSSLMHCSTITQLVYDKSEGDSDCDYGLKNYRQHGVAVKQAHDKLISEEQANLASEKPPPTGGVAEFFVPCSDIEEKHFWMGWLN